MKINMDANCSAALRQNGELKQKKVPHYNAIV